MSPSEAAAEPTVVYGKPFNPRRPFGTCHGDERFHFEQDGQAYDAHKRPVDGDGNRMALPPEAEAADPEPETSEPKPDAGNPDDDMPADEQPFNLLAWAQGDAELAATPFAKVKAETARLIEDMTGITGKEAARKAILAHYGL